MIVFGHALVGQQKHLVAADVVLRAADPENAPQAGFSELADIEIFGPEVLSTHTIRNRILEELHHLEVGLLGLFSNELSIRRIKVFIFVCFVLGQ